MGHFSGPAEGTCERCGYKTGWRASWVQAYLALAYHSDTHVLECAFCSKKFNTFGALFEHAENCHAREKNEMGKTLGQIKQDKGIGGPPMLHGSDLPSKIRSVKITVKELREAPENFKAPAILDFSQEVYGKQSMAVNITNLRALAQIAGYAENEVDNVDFDVIAKKVKGKQITLSVAMVNDPQKKKMVPSLFVTL